MNLASLITDDHSEEEVLAFLRKCRARREIGYWCRVRCDSRTFTERNLLLTIQLLERGDHYGYFSDHGKTCSYLVLRALIQGTGSWYMYPSVTILARLKKNSDPRCAVLFKYVLDPATGLFSLDRLAIWDQLVPTLSQDPTSYLSILVQDIIRYLLMPYLSH